MNISKMEVFCDKKPSMHSENGIEKTSVVKICKLVRYGFERKIGLQNTQLKLPIPIPNTGIPVLSLKPKTGI